MTQIFRIFVLSLVLFTTQSAFAKQPIYTSIFSSAAVSGYDPVAYFTEGTPVKGSDAFTTEHQGADWYFSSAKNLAAFKANPNLYAPQYGGYCAWAVAMNTTAKGDPLQWHIQNDKLYLNVNAEIRAEWLADIDNMITRADTNWPKVVD